jgi:hypothetical protein
VVGPRPEFVYQPGTNPENGASSCVYVRDGEPSCLVGQVLARAGVSIEDLAKMDEGTPDSGTEEEPVGDGDGESAFEVLYENGALPPYLTVTDDAAGILTHVQSRQDQGTPWGQALASVTVYRPTPTLTEEN